MKTYKLMEIFNSIQGEGYMMGTPMLFIRFAMCNLNCDFCDTEWKPPRLLNTHNEIVEAVCLRRPEWVCFTGGEPCIQLERELVADIKGIGATKTAIETNGTMWNEAIPQINYRTISPKRGHPLAPEWINFHGAGGRIHEIRFLVCDTDDDIWDLGLGHSVETNLCFSPVFQTGVDEPMPNPIAVERAIELAIKYNGIVSMQMHKFLGIQ